LVGLAWYEEYHAKHDRLDRSRLSKHTGTEFSELLAAELLLAATFRDRTALIEVFDLLGKN